MVKRTSSAATSRALRGVVFLRRSSSRQEASIEMQLRWAINKAQELGVPLEAAMEDLARIGRGVPQQRGIFLDDAESGDDMARPGLRALDAEALGSEPPTHIFVHKRDRLARPDNIAEMMAIETRWREQGITIVTSGAVFEPTIPGEASIGDTIVGIIEYEQGRAFLKVLAERVIERKILNSERGHRIGGAAPYGFARYLCDASGVILEELQPGRRVRQQGCHTEIQPKDEQKIAIWRQILDWAYIGWGAKRIANHLNQMGIPSPDIGRVRKDNGTPHLVSGRWNAGTVLDLLRNPAIIARQHAGKRAEGRHRRMHPNGARLLTADDRIGAGVRLVHNDDSVVIKQDLAYEPLYDANKWHQIQEKLVARGKCQRGIRRASDPAKYPLALRVIDLTDGCDHLMYSRTNGNRRLLVCSRYVNAGECNHNSVDSEALLAYVVRFLSSATGNLPVRDRLRAALLARAQSEVQHPKPDTERARLDAELRTRQEQAARLQRRFAEEANESIYQALRAQYDRVHERTQTLERELAGRPSLPIERSLPDVEVDKALALLDDAQRIIGDVTAREELPALFERLGLWVGMYFREAIKGTKRKVREPASGILVLGSRKAPVGLYGANNRDGGPEQATNETVNSTLSNPNRHEEGASCRKVNRGD